MILLAKTNKARSPFLWEMGRKIVRLRTEILAPPLTQEEFAVKSGLNRSHLAMIELGRIDVQIETLRVIATALEISLAELFRGLD
jgi:transcriptional regulator with XRE-family HTH domain